MKFYIALFALVGLSQQKEIVQKSSENAHNEVGSLYKPKTNYGNLEYLRALGLRRDQDDAYYDSNTLQVNKDLHI